MGNINSDVVGELPKEKVEGAKDQNLSVTLRLPVLTVSMLCYLTGVFPYAGWMSGLLILILERDRRVRFHAYQSLALFGGLDILWLVLAQTYLFSSLNGVIYIGRFGLWLLLMYKTYDGKDWILPYVGDWAKKQVEAQIGNKAKV